MYAEKQTLLQSLHSYFSSMRYVDHFKKSEYPKFTDFFA